MKSCLTFEIEYTNCIYTAMPYRLFGFSSGSVCFLIFERRQQSTMMQTMTMKPTATPMISASSFLVKKKSNDENDLTEGTNSKANTGVNNL